MQSVDAGFYQHPFLDDLHYHTTAQDFRFNVRYRLVSHPVVITPFIGSVLPSHDYAYVGEAAPGRNLKELQFGTDVGRRLNPFLRRAYLDGQIAFAIPEQALNIRTTRTNLALEMGYLLNRRLAFRGFAHWQHTLNGLHFPEDLTTPEIILTHERLLKANYWHLGGGVSYALTPKTDVSADVVTFLSGSDTHYGTGVSMRIARSFTLRPWAGKGWQDTVELGCVSCHKPGPEDASINSGAPAVRTYTSGRHYFVDLCVVPIADDEDAAVGQ